jgi:hypothetical protein
MRADRIAHLPRFAIGKLQNLVIFSRLLAHGNCLPVVPRSNHDRGSPVR